MLTSGAVSLIVSFTATSSILAFLGLGLVFWGALLRFIAPSKQVPIELLTATASTMRDVEKVLSGSCLTAKGVYLAPRFFRNPESSLVFIPADSGQPLPSPGEIDEVGLTLKIAKGMLFTPPGLALSKLFEKHLGTSFTETNITILQEKLPKLFIEDLEIAEKAEITLENNMITLEIRNSIFEELCQETRKLERLHTSLGCILSSAIACALAKATGKSLTIEGEERSQRGETTRIHFRIMGE